MKKELLSPAGNMECLKMAVQAGCDAVYFGGKNFGARAFSTNFSCDEIRDAIRYCHLYNVKAYVTVNTLVYDDEVEEFLNYVEFLYRENVDALIMQDIGMIYLVHQKFPDVEIHASTQAHNYNKEGLTLLQEMGVTRAVLDRELSLEEIEGLPKKIEKEVFIHGALCISYSGCCYFSSLVGGRSGNRGECAGSCRLPYSLYEDDKKIIDQKFLLSSKEFNTAEYFKYLMESDITSFKIEGRMKSPEYVFYVTRFYREIIDHYEKTKDIVVPSMKNITVLFNRGFTKGHLFNVKNEELVNAISPAHQGIPIAKILEITPKKIKMILLDDLHQNDGIRFVDENKGMMVNFLYDDRDKLINRAFCKDIVYVDNKIGLTSGTKVVKTIDSTLSTKILSFKPKKIPIDINFKATEDGACLTMVEGSVTAKITRPIVTIAQKYPVTEDNIFKQVLRLNDTVYECNSIDIKIEDNLFISVKELNALRRDVVSLLDENRLARIKRRVLPFVPSKLSVDNNPLTIVSSFDSLLPDEAYISFDNKDNLVLNRINTNFNYDNRTLLISELGGVRLAKNNTVYSNYMLNVTNSYSVYYLLLQGVQRVGLSIEMNDDQIKCLIHSFKQIFEFNPPIMLFLYGRIALMIMKYCPVRANLGSEKFSCKSHQYYLEDRMNKKYPLKLDCKYSTLYHSEVTNLIPEISKYQRMGISSFHVDFTFENSEIQKNILEQVKALITHV